MKKPKYRKGILSKLSNEQLAEIINRNPTINAAACEIGVCAASLYRHCIRDGKPDNPARIAYKKKSYTNTSSEKRYLAMSEGDPRRLEFCVSMSTEERDHLLNLDMPIAFRGKRHSSHWCGRIKMNDEE